MIERSKVGDSAIFRAGLGGVKSQLRVFADSGERSRERRLASADRACGVRTAVTDRSIVGFQSHQRAGGAVRDGLPPCRVCRDTLHDRPAGLVDDLISSRPVRSIAGRVSWAALGLRDSPDRYQDAQAQLDQWFVQFIDRACSNILGRARSTRST